MQQRCELETEKHDHSHRLSKFFCFVLFCFALFCFLNTTDMSANFLHRVLFRHPGNRWRHDLGSSWFDFFFHFYFLIF